MDRNLDGIYFRVQRDEKWGNACFSDLTQEEMEMVMENRDVDWLKSMCIQLGKTIRRIGLNDPPKMVHRSTNRKEVDNHILNR